MTTKPATPTRDPYKDSARFRSSANMPAKVPSAPAEQKRRPSGT